MKKFAVSAAVFAFLPLMILFFLSSCGAQGSDTVSPPGKMDFKDKKDYTAENIFALFEEEHGSLATGIIENISNGEFDDNAIMAVVMRILPDNTGTKEQASALALKYFGKTPKSFETASSTIEDGKLVFTPFIPTSINYYPILKGAPVFEGDGSVTATFNVYSNADDIKDFDKITASPDLVVKINFTVKTDGEDSYPVFHSGEIVG